MSRFLITSIVLIPLVLISSSQALAQPDVITLESQVKGNQEQPNVLSIVPWKFADDLSRLDQGIEADIGRLFQHLDRDEFTRQQYFYRHFLQAELGDQSPADKKMNNNE